MKARSISTRCQALPAAVGTGTGIPDFHIPIEMLPVKYGYRAFDYDRSFLSHYSANMKRILVVDDEVDSLTVVKRMLEQTGRYFTTMYSDPIAALKAFEPDKFDLVLLDIRMPGISGADLFKKLKKIDDKIKGCFMTGAQKDEFAARYPDVVPDCFMQKPFTMAKLIENVDSLMGN
jgi:CheY-like chemotaxis protein